MGEIISEERHKRALEEFRGSFAQIWHYNVSLKKLILRLSKKDSNKVLFIVSLGSEMINGCFSWKNSNITTHLNKTVDGDIIDELVDSEASFKLASSGGLAMMYGSTSDDFPRLDDANMNK